MCSNVTFLPPVHELTGCLAFDVPTSERVARAVRGLRPTPCSLPLSAALLACHCSFIDSLLSNPQPHPSLYPFPSPSRFLLLMRCDASSLLITRRGDSGEDSGRQPSGRCFELVCARARGLLPSTLQQGPLVMPGGRWQHALCGVDPLRPKTATALPRSWRVAAAARCFAALACPASSGWSGR
jgi:hypothetical protein